MTKEQLNRMEELSNILDCGECGSEEWKNAYNEYFELVAIQNNEYRMTHEADLLKYYEEHIKGKSGRELSRSSEWEYYSDYYKDVYGHRPHLGLDEIA